MSTARTPLAGATLTQLSAAGYPGGLAATCAVSSACRAYCWGAGRSGQLGNGTNTSTQDTPVAVTAAGALAGATVTQVTVGTGFACALSSVGAAYCWGAGGSGQLGDSAARSRNVPVAVTTDRVLAGVSLIQISSGQLASCAQDSTGAFYCWGGNRSGQLGNGSTTSSNAPAAVAGIVPWAPTSVIAWPGNATARVSWTAPASLGIGTLTGYTATASPGGARCVTSSAVSCTITGLANGTTYRVSVITRTTDGDSAPSRAVTATPWPPDTGIAACRASACTLARGHAYCWGDDTDGELGNDISTPAPQTTPVAVDTDGALSGVTLTQLVAGNRFSCALSTAGAVYCWGAGASGQLGDGSHSSSDVPVAVTARAGTPLHHERVTQIAAGGSSVCGLSATGAVYCWGAGSSGQLGDGSHTSSDVPVTVTATGTLGKAATVTQIAAGGSSACALSTTGTVYCWGAGSSGQLGDGSHTSSDVPAAVTARAGTPLHDVQLTQITAGGSSACALSATGTVYCWGAGASGQLGNGSHTSSDVPVTVTATRTPLRHVRVTQIAAGGSSACALSATGAVYCWGADTSGQLGNGTSTAAQDVPVAVSASPGTPLDNKTVTQIDSGAAFTCALNSAGTAYCWGQGSNGQLGNDSTVEQPTAVLVGPAAPTGVTGAPGNTTITVSWTRPAVPEQRHADRLHGQCQPGPGPVRHDTRDKLHAHRPEERDPVHDHRGQPGQYRHFRAQQPGDGPAHRPVPDFPRLADMEHYRERSRPEHG